MAGSMHRCINWRQNDCLADLIATLEELDEALHNATGPAQRDGRRLGLDPRNEISWDLGAQCPPRRTGRGAVPWSRTSGPRTQRGSRAPGECLHSNGVHVPDDRRSTRATMSSATSTGRS